MNKEDLKDKIQGIEERIDALFTDYSLLLQSNIKLEDDKKGLEKIISQQRQEIAELKNYIILLKKSEGKPLNGHEKTDLNKLLNEHIREIDECIAMLK